MVEAAAQLLYFPDSPSLGEEEEEEEEAEEEVEKQREMATTRKAGDHREQDHREQLRTVDGMPRRTASACTAQALEPCQSTYYKRHRHSLSSLGLYTNDYWLG